MRSKKISARMILVAILAWFFARNLMTPPAFDDYVYAFVWNEHESASGNIYERLIDLDRRVETIGDIIESQRSHYMTWGGRTVVHCLVQFFVSIDKVCFDLANALVFGLLIVLIARLAEVRLSVKSVLWIVFGLWLCAPFWMNTTLWLTGSINYLWASALQLFFLSNFLSRPPAHERLHLSNRLNGSEPAPEAFPRPNDRDRSKPALQTFSRSPAFDRLKTFFLIPIGLMAGWSNEAGGLVTLLLAAYFCFRRREPRMIVGLVSASIGYALLMLAPGNFNRLQLISPDFHLTLALVIDHFRSGFLNVLSGEAILFVPIVFARSNEKILVFTLAALLVPSAMLFAPFFAEYACLASTIFLLIASTAALDRLNLDRFRSIAVVLSIVLSIGMMSSLVADFRLWRQTQSQLSLIESKRGADCELPPMNYSETLIRLLGSRVANVYLGRQHAFGVCGDPKDFYNRAIASYYGLHEVKLTDEN